MHDLGVCDMPGRDTAPGFLLQRLSSAEGGRFGQTNPSCESATMGGAALRYKSMPSFVERTVSCIFPVFNRVRPRLRSTRAGGWPQTYSYTVRPATMVRTTRPCSLASSKGVFLHFDLSSAGSSTHGESMSTTMTSAGLPCRSVPPARPRISAGRLHMAFVRGHK